MNKIYIAAWPTVSDYSCHDKISPFCFSFFLLKFIIGELQGLRADMKEGGNEWDQDSWCENTKNNKKESKKYTAEKQKNLVEK